MLKLNVFASLCLTLLACSPLAIAATPTVPPIAQAQSSAPTTSALITMERTPCFGSCPAYRLTVYGDGRVVYDGLAFVATEGRRTAQLEPAQVQSLIAAVERADFFKLNDEYIVDATDLPGTRTAIALNGRTKTVWRYGSAGDASLDNAPRSLSELENAIDAIVNSQQWVEQ